MTLTPRVVGGPLITERQVTKCSVAALIGDVNVTTRASHAHPYHHLYHYSRPHKD